jgi:hypothetical protein
MPGVGLKTFHVLTDLSQLQLVYPEREWHLDNRWFVKQSEFYVRLTTKGPGK